MLYMDTGNIINEFRKNFELMKSPFFNNFNTEYDDNLRYNLYENDDGTYLLELVVPGYTKDEIEVVQEGDHLKIKGRRENKKNSKVLHYGVKLNNSFEKLFKLSKGSFVKSADLSNGILNVLIGLPEEEQKRKIEIN